MKLIAWLREQPHGSRTKLACRMVVHPAHLDRIARGTRSCSPKLAAAISRLTNGEVSVVELLYPDGLPEGATIAPTAELLRLFFPGGLPGRVCMAPDGDRVIRDSIPGRGGGTRVADGNGDLPPVAT